MNKQEQKSIPFLSVSPNGCILIDGRPANKDILQLNLDSAEYIILPTVVKVGNASEILNEHYSYVDEDVSADANMVQEDAAALLVHDHDYQDSKTQEYYVYSTQEDDSTEDASEAIIFSTHESDIINNKFFVKGESVIEPLNDPNFVGLLNNYSTDCNNSELQQRTIFQIKKENEESEYFEYKMNIGDITKQKENSVHKVESSPRIFKSSPFVCQICEKSFSQQSNLWKHIRTHTGERPYRCPTCAKQFSQRANMIKHQVVHTGQRPYECNICHKGFTQQANLTKHMRLHTGEKPFQCDFCSKKFTQRSNLIKHRYLHLGIKPYSCPSCFQTFTQQSNLKKHILIHTDIKKHFCKFCNKGYVQKISVQKHMERCKPSPEMTITACKVNINA